MLEGTTELRTDEVWETCMLYNEFFKLKVGNETRRGVGVIHWFLDDHSLLCREKPMKRKNNLISFVIISLCLNRREDWKACEDFSTRSITPTIHLSLIWRYFRPIPVFCRVC